MMRNKPAMRRATCKVGGDKEVIGAPSLKEFEAAWEAAAGSSSAAGHASDISKIIHNHCNGACRKPSGMPPVKLSGRQRRSPYLLVKYHARNHALQVMVGALALLQNVGKTAPEIAVGAHAVVSSICARGAYADTCNPGKRCNRSLMMMR